MDLIATVVTLVTETIRLATAVVAAVKAIEETQGDAWKEGDDKTKK